MTRSSGWTSDRETLQNGFVRWDVGGIRFTYRPMIDPATQGFLPRIFSLSYTDQDTRGQPLETSTLSLGICGPGRGRVRKPLGEDSYSWFQTLGYDVRFRP